MGFFIKTQQSDRTRPSKYFKKIPVSGLRAAGDIFVSFGCHFRSWLKAYIASWITLWVVMFVVFVLFPVNIADLVKVMRDDTGFDFLLGNMGVGPLWLLIPIFLTPMMLALPFTQLAVHKNPITLLSLYAWHYERWKLLFFNIVYELIGCCFLFFICASLMSPWWIGYSSIRFIAPLCIALILVVAITVFTLHLLMRLKSYPGFIADKVPHPFRAAWRLSRYYGWEVWWGYVWITLFLICTTWLIDWIWMKCVGGSSYALDGPGKASLKWWVPGYIACIFTLWYSWTFSYAGNLYRRLKSAQGEKDAKDSNA